MRISDWSSDVCSSDLPLILAEGKTDSIYLVAAIRSLAPAFPTLSPAGGGELLVRFPRSTASFERLFDLTGGQDPLQKFISQYRSEYKPIKGPTGTQPVIVDRKSTRLNSSH